MDAREAAYDAVILPVHLFAPNPKLTGSATTVQCQRREVAPSSEKLKHRFAVPSSHRRCPPPKGARSSLAGRTRRSRLWPEALAATAGCSSEVTPLAPSPLARPAPSGQSFWSPRAALAEPTLPASHAYTPFLSSAPFCTCCSLQLDRRLPFPPSLSPTRSTYENSA